MHFRYRFVDYGTIFTTVVGVRTNSGETSSRLYSNELVVDVGGCCWHVDGESRTVLDHHFSRTDCGQFPSASAAVLHQAAAIHARYSNCEEVWLVTHREPDFDAYCAMYLARRILESGPSGITIPQGIAQEIGLRPEGWFRGVNEIDWIDPKINALTDDLYWPTVLASYASCVDNGRRFVCRRSQTLHAILYAAIKRGRYYEKESSGAVEFFDEIVKHLHNSGSPTISVGRLNPLYDPVLSRSELFQPELDLLQSEELAYARDIKRARKSVVFLQQSPNTFEEWNPAVIEEPLLTDAGKENPRHISLAGHKRVPADGVYLRDPECLLFKEWARLDIENSPNGRGFLFTAIAYSERKSLAKVNSSEYFFSLDPERAGRCHLYSAWARLQGMEVMALQQPKHAVSRQALEVESDGKARSGYEERAGSLGPLFFDPWYDGSAYRHTIVVTSNRGSLIAPPGRLPDLSDDDIASIVRGELEFAAFEGDVTFDDFGTDPASPVVVQTQQPILQTLVEPRVPAAATIRMSAIQLSGGIDLLDTGVAEQIGEWLWRTIDPEHQRGLPSDFLARHLRYDERTVAVWSRRGIAIGYLPGAHQDTQAVKEVLEKTARLQRRVSELLLQSASPSAPAAKCLPDPAHDVISESLVETDRLVNELLVLQRSLSSVEGRIVRTFFEAIGIDATLQAIERLKHDAFTRRQLTETQRNTKFVADAGRVAEVIEYLVVAIHFVELWHLVGPEDYSHGKHLGYAFCVGIVFTDIVNHLVLGHSICGRLFGLGKHEEAD